MPYLTVQEMRENAENMKWDHAYEKGGTRFVGSTSPEIALKYIPKKGSVLECGPAFGPFTKFLQDNGYEDIHALDFIDTLRFPDRNRLTFSLLDFNTEKMPYPDKFFNGVMCWGMGEHLENQFHFMREVHRVLKDDRLFVYSLPNVFHIMSRLLFLKKGIFPRWEYRNNHITVLPRGVFEKTYLRYFDLVDTIYTKPGIQFGFLEKFSKFLPANEWFGNYVVYILRKRPEIKKVTQT